MQVQLYIPICQKHGRAAAFLWPQTSNSGTLSPVSDTGTVAAQDRPSAPGTGTLPSTLCAHLCSASCTSVSWASTMRSTSWTWGSSQAMTAGSFHRACVLPTYRDVSWFRAGDWLWEMVVTHSTLLLLLLLRGW